MDGFIEVGNKIIKDVETRMKNIPEDKRPNTMILFKLIDGVPQLSGQGVFGDYWLQHLGVKNVAGEAKGFTQVSFEQIYEWNPQVNKTGKYVYGQSQDILNEKNISNVFHVNVAVNEFYYNNRIVKSIVPISITIKGERL